jgi:hypothetical protein
MHPSATISRVTRCVRVWCMSMVYEVPVV